MRRWWPLLLLPVVLVLRFPGALPGPAVVSAHDHLSVHHAFQGADEGGFVRHPHLSDPALQFAALQRRTVAALRRGEAPLWNPDLFGGAPLLADGQSMAASPVTWARAALPDDVAQDLGVAWILVWLGLGTAVLLAALGAGPWGAAVGGAAAMLGPYPSVWLLHPHAATFCWLPWVILSVERRSGWAAALAVAGMAGGGHPGTLVQGLGVAGVWWLARSRSVEVALGVAVGGLLAAPVLAPLAELAGRSATLTARQAVPLEPRQLLDLLWPGFLGHPVSGSWTGPGSWADGQLHPGLAALGLALWGARTRGGRALVVGWMALVALSFAPLPGPFAHGRLGSQGAWLLAVAAGLAVDRGLSRRWAPAALAAVVATGLWARWDDQGTLPAEQHGPEPAAWTAELRAALCGSGSAGEPEGAPCARVLGLRWALQPNTGALVGLADLRGYDLPVSRQTRRLLVALHPRPRGPWYPVPEVPSVALLRFLGVQAVLATPEDSVQLDQIGLEPLPLTDAPLVAARVADPAPPAWLARQARSEVFADRAVRLTAGSATGVARPVVEARVPDALQSDGPPLPPVALTPAWVGASRVQLALPGEPGLVVLQQSWDPGWRATVDGAPRAVQRVGGLLVGVFVEAGEGSLDLRYRPDGWIRGLQGGAVGALGLGGLLVIARRRRRRPAGPSPG